MDDKPKLFTKDRFYQAGLVLLALLALGIFIAKVISEGKLRDAQQAADEQHQQAVQALEAKHAEDLIAARERGLAVLASILRAVPTPTTFEPAGFYPLLDALVRDPDVSLALVATADGQVMASSNRHFEGKALSEVVSEDLGKVDARGLLASEAGWLVVAPLAGAEGAAGRVVVRVERVKTH